MICAYCGEKVTVDWDLTLRHKQLVKTTDGPKRFICTGWCIEGPNVIYEKDDV